MALQFEMTFTVDGNLYDRDAIVSATAKTIVPAVTESVLLLERDTKLNFPIGASGLGRNSIESGTQIVRGRILEVRGEVFSPLAYVSHVEFGTRPHWVPIRPLKLWAKRKFGDENIAYAVRAVIAKRGTRAQKIFANALRKNTARIEGIINAAGQRWEAFLSR